MIDAIIGIVFLGGICYLKGKTSNTGRRPKGVIDSVDKGSREILSEDAKKRTSEDLKDKAANSSSQRVREAAQKELKRRNQ